MANFLFPNFWTWKGEEYRFDVFRDQDFDLLPDIKQVYGIILNKELTQVLVVNDRGEMWIMPGGKVEGTETPIQTLIREVKEETNRDLNIDSIRPAFYQICNMKTGNKWQRKRAEVRYIAIIEKDNLFVQDPDNGDITEARWIPIEELANFIDWGNVTTLMSEIIADYKKECVELPNLPSLD